MVMVCWTAMLRSHPKWRPGRFWGCHPSPKRLGQVKHLQCDKLHLKTHGFPENIKSELATVEQFVTATDIGAGTMTYYVPVVPIKSVKPWDPYNLLNLTVTWETNGPPQIGSLQDLVIIPKQFCLLSLYRNHEPALNMP